MHTNFNLPHQVNSMGQGWMQDCAHWQSEVVVVATLSTTL